MTRSLPCLLILLLLLSQATPCAAQGVARAPKDEAPLAAAFRLARRLEPGPDRDSALLGLANIYQAAARLEEAVRAAEAMDDGEMKALTLNRLANRFADAGQLDRAAELLSQSLSVIRRAKDEQGLSAEVLRELVVGELRHDFEAVPARTEMLKGALARLFEGGRAEAAADILAQVRELALDPDLDALSAARLLACASRLYAKSDGAQTVEVLAEALAAARRAEDDGERIRGLAEVGRAYADAGDRKTAEALLDEAQQFAASFGDYMDNELRDVAHAYAAAGLTDKALKALPATDDDVWESTLVYFQASAAASAGRPEALKESLARALVRASSFEWDNTKSRALSDLAAAYGRLAPELLAEVLWAARALENHSERASALAAVGDRYTEAGRKEAALDAWGQAYEAARAVRLRASDYEPRSSIRGDADKMRLLSALALKLIRAGEYGRAPEFARDLRAVQAAALALTRGRTASVREADAYVAGLAEELTRAGQKESALAVLAEAGDQDEKPGQNIDPFSRAAALAAVGAAYAKAGDRARAAVYLRRALQLADGLDDRSGQETYWSLVAIGARYAEAGMTPDARARKSLRRLVRVVEENQE